MVLGPNGLTGKWVFWGHHGVFKTMHVNVFGWDVQFSVGCTHPPPTARCLKPTTSHAHLAGTAPGVPGDRLGWAVETPSPQISVA